MKSHPLEKSAWLESLLTGGPRTSVPATFFRREFHLPAPVKQASLHLTALGLGECEINGRVSGDSVLIPGWTDYRKRVYYQTHDVTPLLRQGPNALGVVLGDGWYCGHVANLDRQNYGLRPLFALCLTVETEEATHHVTTDGDWKAATGPIVNNDLIMGETQDARLELIGWSTPGFDDSAWESARLAPRPALSLEPSPAPPVKRHETVSPKGIGPDRELPDGGRGWLLDFGQNLSGRVRLWARGARGTRLTIRHGEMLEKDGRLHIANLRSALATDVYICKGEESESWEPRFTFHGFRYAEISHDAGAGGVVLERARAVVLHSSVTPAGGFECSHPLINHLHRNIDWSLKGNFLDIPTDCPQRDERLGWTGDAQVFLRTASLLRDVRGFFYKWLCDMRDAQGQDGAIPRFCPNLPAFGAQRDGGPAWSDAVYLCPWVLYEQYGDKTILADHYPTMKRHMDYLTVNRVKDHIREHPDLGGWQGFGDWLAPDGSGKTTGRTPHDLIGTAFYSEAARILANTAEILGQSEEAEGWHALRSSIVKAFRQRFLGENGVPLAETQTALVLSLRFNLVPEEKRPKVAAELVRMIKENGCRLATGFVGTPYLLPVLEAHGHLETAYRLLEQTDCPSWLFPVTQGATTIWERWDAWTPDRGFHAEGMNSFNHYAYGSVGEWLYSTVAGLAPAEPGYRKILFKPRPGGSLTFASAHLRTPQGDAGIDWEMRGKTLRLSLKVPPEVEARLSLPAPWRGGEEILGSGVHHREIHPQSENDQ